MDTRGNKLFVCKVSHRVDLVVRERDLDGGWALLLVAECRGDGWKETVDAIWSANGWIISLQF